MPEYLQVFTQNPCSFKREPWSFLRKGRETCPGDRIHRASFMGGTGNAVVTARALPDSVDAASISLVDTSSSSTQEQLAKALGPVLPDRHNKSCRLGGQGALKCEHICSHCE
jgi:hypothetical protein